jgi:hypothetical protein
MPLPVQLKKVVEEMEFGGNEWAAYINCQTGELASFPADLLGKEGEVDAPAQDWELEMAEDCKKVLGSKDFIKLPSEHDIHEYAIMERFCLSVASEQHRQRLLDAISGKGAFRRFKDLVNNLEIEQDWYRYRDEAVKKIAADFLEAQNIPYIDDDGGKTQ